ncbi:phospholipase D-like domain-containing protein [Bacillus cereus]
MSLSCGRIIHLKACTFSFFPLRQSDFHLYTYGKDLYDALFTDIKQAKHHVHVLFFIVKNDKISQEFLKLLIDKAKEGIEVKTSTRSIGKPSFYQMRPFAPYKNMVSLFIFVYEVKFPFPLFSANQRNHRKITVIDRKIGYIGGFNIGEEYLGHNQEIRIMAAIIIYVLQEKRYKIYKSNFYMIGWTIQIKIY